MNVSQSHAAAATSTVAPLLSVNDVAKSHGRVEILRGVSLKLQRGRVGVLIGQSGSGKSTLLRCINGLEEFDRGEVTVGDHCVTAGLAARQRQDALSKVRSCVGMVFQQFNLFPHLSAIENVTEGPMYVRGESRASATESAKKLLDRVGLSHRLEWMPHQLSGGEQQRVAIARALAMKPDLVLFDEPTSALDPRMTAEVLAVMADLATDGLTMLVVTHAMGFARKVANDVHVMAAGQIVESGTPEQVFGMPQHNLTRELLHELEHH